MGVYHVEMKKDLRLRIVDFIGHCAFGLLLPGPFWSQFLPEVFGPALLIHGLFSGRILPKNHPLVQLQNMMHTIYIPILMILPALFIDVHEIHIWKYALQYTVHIIWDQFTHELDWQKRSLWRL